MHAHFIPFNEDPVNRLLSSNRHVSNLLVDGGIYMLALTLAYLIRFEGPPDSIYVRQFVYLLPIVLGIRLATNEAFAIYRQMWRYICLPDAMHLAAPASVGTFVLLAFRLAALCSGVPPLVAAIPFSIIALEFLLSLTGTLGVRCLQRLLCERNDRASRATSKPPKRIALYGAGSAGAILLRDLQTNPDVTVIGFFDDDMRKVGTLIGGVRVLSTGDRLCELVRAERIDEVVVSIASAGSRTLTTILEKCKLCPVPAKVVPTLCELLSGQVSVSKIRTVTIEDLLARETLTQLELLDDLTLYSGKRILVTGGGGSIGSELVRQLLTYNPTSVGILDKDENGVYDIEQEMKRKYGKPPLELFIADVRNPDRLRDIFKSCRPQIVFHAAAHKHVPLMEGNVCEAVLNNVGGTHNVLQLSQEAGCERFVFISSDKAVNPTNIMGATKRLGEMLIKANTGNSRMRSAAVRFGNVLGSRGSVIPLFQRQIAEGGPVTVTHEKMTRFFMTIPEAVHLVLRAGTLAEAGDIFMLDMGEPRRILDVACDMIRLSGLEPGRDIKVVFTGLRPGEKLHEELVRPEEKVFPTGYSKLSRISVGALDRDAFSGQLSRLVRSAQRYSRAEVYGMLCEMDLGFRPTPDLVPEAGNGEMVRVAAAAR
jgi:FlaA1/EpsC-like NDP-sugar epimerase